MPTVSSHHPRMRRIYRTVEAMIRIYCHAHHETRVALCPECDKLLLYAQERLSKCPFQEAKTTCANCPTHCYRKAPGERIRAVMRYAGPRMLYRHPFLALLHLVDGWRKEPLRAKGRAIIDGAQGSGSNESRAVCLERSAPNQRIEPTDTERG
jgi:hypothetical protein